MAGSASAEIAAAIIAVLEDAIDSDVDLAAFFSQWSRRQRRKLAEAVGEADAMWAAARGGASGGVTGPPAKKAAPIPPPQQTARQRRLRRP